jgi:hypothetical protein
MKKKALKFAKNRWTIGIGAFLLAAIVILGIRFFTYKTPSTHYHSNFAVYINGAQEKFADNKYYEETSMCQVNAKTTNAGITDPVERAHMHKTGDTDYETIHVEDHAVTYGAFFANLGWTLGTDFIADDQGNIYKNLQIELNGQIVLNSLANVVIKDKDRVVFVAGDEQISTSELNGDFAKVPSTAEKFDTTSDPASCAGSLDDKTTFQDRLSHLF